MTLTPLHLVVTGQFLPAIRYASAGISRHHVSVCLSVRHKPAEKRALWLSHMTQGKPSVVAMACAAGHCSWENPTWLMHATSGNAILHSV